MKTPPSVDVGETLSLSSAQLSLLIDSVGEETQSGPVPEHDLDQVRPGAAAEHEQ